MNIRIINNKKGYGYSFDTKNKDYLDDLLYLCGEDQEITDKINIYLESTAYISIDGDIDRIPINKDMFKSIGVDYYAMLDNDELWNESLGVYSYTTLKTENNENLITRIINDLLEDYFNNPQSETDLDEAIFSLFYDVDFKEQGSTHDILQETIQIGAVDMYDITIYLNFNISHTTITYEIGD